MIVGEKELETQTVVLRNMVTKEQVDIPIDQIVKEVKKIVKK